MAVLLYNDLEFNEKDERIEVRFLDRFCFDIDKTELDSIGEFVILDSKKIEFDGKEAKVKRLFDHLISSKIERSLKTKDGRKAIYVHQGPLIGSQAFGILDSDTNCVELRPITGCNLNCVFCSVDEKLKKGPCYVIDLDLLVSEFQKLAEKKNHPLYVHISAQGEPLFYSKIVELVSEISKIEKIQIVSIGTNGTLLTKELIDKLVDAGLHRINLSVNAIDPQIAKKLAGSLEYDIEEILKIAKYIKSKNIDLIIAPVYLQKLNHEEMGKVIQFAKEIGCQIGIQNFLEYSSGRKPVKQLEWDEFYKILEGFEKKYDVKLKNPELGFEIKEDKALERPFKKGQKIIAEGIYLGYASAGDRLIALQGRMTKKKQKLKLIREKHNIYIGAPLV
ncbi:MAG: radical SAM protein [Nanoarchaeota archaeon]|nr:radical SAM protein [Nanoarchaeota archaeon]